MSDPTLDTALIPAGAFLMGSTMDERALALELEYASRDRLIPEATAWLAREYDQRKVHLAPYRIMIRPVTQLEYLSYVRQTGAPEPYVDAQSWATQQVGIGYAEVQSQIWKRGVPDRERERHPVVLVSYDDARNFCAWWGRARGGDGKLPSEAQWEKAARGTEGSTYPWGSEFRPSRLNSAEAGPIDTTSVGIHESGASPFGVLDMAGNVFEWTRSRGMSRDEAVVKGGAYSSHGGFVRPAARDFRAKQTRHYAIGFRCVLEETPATTQKADPPSKR